MNFGRVFARRSAVCFFMMCVLFLSCCLRLYSVATGPYADVQNRQSSLRLQIARPRGTIYDRNMLPINNQYNKMIAAVSPTPRAIVAISSEKRESDELDGILERLSSGKPVICEVEKEIECDGIVCSKIAVPHRADQPAEHIVGYIDSTGHGVTGLEEAYDDLLYSQETIDAIFKTDGMGRVMEGEKIEIVGELSSIGNCIVTTLDLNIQAVAEKAALSIDRGAIVIADAKTNQIRSLVSKPSYDCTRIQDFLNRSDAPLLNRTLSAYSVGSVFKPCVAAAGITAGKSNYVTQCLGKTKITDREFRCHYSTGHGRVNLAKALAQSCNVFFYKFALHIGRESVYNMASSLGFGNTITIAEDISTAAGSITPYEELSNDAALANMSIGQGKVSISPISMLTLYSAIASNGSYYLPSLISATIKSGERNDEKKGSPTRVMSEDAAATLREALRGVVTDGTGKTAAPTICTAAGKTATAQTGTYDKKGREITNGWFCGFFPVENPRYVVVIMEEDAIGSDVSPIFAEIADGIIGLGDLCD